MAKTKTLTVEQISQKKDSIRSEIDSLKEVALNSKDSSEFLKKNDEISKSISQLQAEIDNVQASSESEKKELEKVKTDLDRFSRWLASIKTSVVDVKSSADKVDTKWGMSTNAVPDKNGIWESVKSFITENWDKIWDGDAWKTEKWKNVLRVVWFAATWIWALALIYKWVKALFSSDEDEEDEEEEEKPKKKKKKKTSWWKKWLAWAWWILWATAIWTWAYKNWNYLSWKVNDLLGRNLTFEEALTKAEALVLNRAEEAPMRKHLWFKFHEDTSELEAFHNRVKIDKKKKRIVWLNISFPNYEEMLTAATLINYMKFAYSWLWASAKPFHVYSDFEWWDIWVSLATWTEDWISWSWNTWEILWWTIGSMLSLVAWIYSKSPKVWLSVAAVAIPSWIIAWNWLDGKNTLHQICPTLDSQHSKDLFTVYLNELWCWKKGNQNLDEVSQSPIMNEVKKVIKEIEDTDPDDWKKDNRWNERKLDAVPVSWTTDKIKITSYGWVETIVTVNMKNKTMKIDNLDIVFPLEEWIRTANFTNMMKKNYAWECWDNDKPFSYKWSIITAGHPWLYISLPWSISNPASAYTRVLTQDMMEKKFPKLLEKVDSHYVPYLNKIKDEDTNMPLWVSR